MHPWCDWIDNHNRLTRTRRGAQHTSHVMHDEGRHRTLLKSHSSYNAHTHIVDIDAHTHTVPAHAHDIAYGIYEGTTPDRGRSGWCAEA